jgi:hypothetical protein
VRTLILLASLCPIIPACGGEPTDPENENEGSEPQVLVEVTAVKDVECSVTWVADAVNNTVLVTWALEWKRLDGSGCAGSLGGCPQGTFRDSMSTSWTFSNADNQDITWTLTTAAWDTTGAHRVRSCAVTG